MTEREAATPISAPAATDATPIHWWLVVKLKLRCTTRVSTRWIAERTTLAGRSESRPGRLSTNRRVTWMAV
jgi:hypothetical protein